MITEHVRIGLIGVGPRDRGACEAWCNTFGFLLSAFPLEPGPELARIRQFGAVAIGVEERPLLSLAECGRLRAALPHFPLALLGPFDAELEAAAERAGVLFMPCPTGESAWHGLGALMTARRLELRSEGETWISPRLRLDRTARVLYVDGEKRTLTAAKFDLFAYLVDHAGRAVPARELVERGLLLPSQASRYKGLIAELRQHLGIERDCIRAVPGYGYRLDLGERGSRPQLRSDFSPRPGAGAPNQNPALTATVDPRSVTPIRPLFL
ncbi:MAG TPA: hypothetical protein VGK73_27705 [Polyangiaceae bacterium]